MEIVCILNIPINITFLKTNLFTSKIFLAIPITKCSFIDVIKSGGIKLCGIKANLALRKQNLLSKPKLEKNIFLPYLNNKVL